MAQMKLLERLQAAYKVFTQGDWISSDAPGNIYSSNRGGRGYFIPGTILNWDRLTGDAWACPAVQACLNVLYRNMPLAPPIIQQMDAKGEWETVPDHPLLAILKRPNPRYDWTVFLQGIILSAETNGNAYAIIERTPVGQLAELWWAPHQSVNPYTAPGNDPRQIDYYEYWIRGKRIEVPPEDMWHFKNGPPDPYDERIAISPLASAARDVNALQQAGNYRPTIMRNFGVTGRMVWPEDPNVQMEPETVKAMIDANSQGDRAGSTTVFDFKVGVDYPKTSPQDMALDTIEDRPEADICALFGVPIMVTGLHGGREAKTYANMKEAREALWEEKNIPFLAMIAGQLGYKLVPEFSGAKNPQELAAYMATVRIAFDYSDIRPLQPDLDALHTRLAKNWQLNIITLGQWYQMSGEPAPEDLPDWETLKDMRYRDLAGGPSVVNPDMQPQDMANATAAPNAPNAPNKQGKSVDNLDWAERVIRDIELTHKPQAVALNGNGNGNGTGH